jgi:hypothetical protein
MKRIALMVCAVLALTLATGTCKASWGSLSYSGYQPWWNIFAKRYKCLTPEEERLQKFWHDYYNALKEFYCSLDAIDWVAYYKNHGYQINACGAGGGCGRINYAPVFVSPTLQWAVPAGCAGGPPVGPPYANGYTQPMMPMGPMGPYGPGPMAGGYPGGHGYPMGMAGNGYPMGMGGNGYPMGMGGNVQPAPSANGGNHGPSAGNPHANPNGGAPNPIPNGGTPNGGVPNTGNPNGGGVPSGNPNGKIPNGGVPNPGAPGQGQPTPNGMPVVPNNMLPGATN